MLRGGLVESGLKLFEFRPDWFCHSLCEAFRGILLRREVRVRAADDSVRRIDVVLQPRCPCSFQCAGPVGAPRVIFLHV